MLRYLVKRRLGLPLSHCVILDTMNLFKLITTIAATSVPKYPRMLLKIKCNSSWVTWPGNCQSTVETLASLNIIVVAAVKCVQKGD